MRVYEVMVLLGPQKAQLLLYMIYRARGVRLQGVPQVGWGRWQQGVLQTKTRKPLCNPQTRYQRMGPTAEVWETEKPEIASQFSVMADVTETPPEGSTKRTRRLRR